MQRDVTQADETQWRVRAAGSDGEFVCYLYFSFCLGGFPRQGGAGTGAAGD